MAIFTLTKCALTLENNLGSQLHVGAGRGHSGCPSTFCAVFQRSGNVSMEC